MEKLTIENFRSIKDKITIDLTKINILTGPNNSGKSNILKLLVLISDYLNSDNHFILSFNGISSGKHKIGSFQNAINWNNWKSKKTLKFSYERDIYIISFEFVPNVDSKNSKGVTEIQTGKLFRFEFVNKINNSRISIQNKSEFEYEIYADSSIISDLWLGKDFDKNDNDTKSRLEANESFYMKKIEDLFFQAKDLYKNNEEFWKKLDSIAFHSRFLESIRYKLGEYRTGKDKNPGTNPVCIIYNSVRDIDKGPRTISFIVKNTLQEYFRKIATDISKDEKISVNNELAHLYRKLDAFIKIPLMHMNPDRSNQVRIHLNSENTTEISRIISSFNSKPFKKDGPANIFLIKWMKNLKIGDNYRFRSLEGIATAVEIKDRQGWHNIVDKGFGAGQIFSLLIRIAEYVEKTGPKTGNYYKEAPSFPLVVAIEEPEANLHPKFQSYLADIFFDAVKIANLQFLIETHSEYFIRRFQFLVADSSFELDNTDVKIFYFNDPYLLANATDLIYDLEIRPDGMLKKDFGPGFFDESTRLTIDLLKSQKN
jgi:predicted ATP-dependent endonuclease of OLD family